MSGEIKRAACLAVLCSDLFQNERVHEIERLVSRHGSTRNPDMTENVMRDAALYFVTKTHTYGVDVLAYILPLDYPDTWKNASYSVGGTKSLITKTAKAVVKMDTGVSSDTTYEDAVNICVNYGIINTPTYWNSLENATSVKTNFVQAFIRQAAAWFVKMDYQCAVSGVKNAINMNSESVWRDQEFTIGRTKALIKAIYNAL